MRLPIELNCVNLSLIKYWYCTVVIFSICTICLANDVSKVKTSDLDSISALEKQLAASKEDFNRITILNNLALQYLGRDVGEAFRYASKGLFFSEKLKNTKGLMQSYLSLGTIYEFSGNYRFACINFIEILELKKQNYPRTNSRASLQPREEIANLLVKIGVIFETVGDLSSAMQYYFRSLSINREVIEFYRKIDDSDSLSAESIAVDTIRIKLSIAKAQEHIASVYLKQGKESQTKDDTAQAFIEYSTALKMFLNEYAIVEEHGGATVVANSYVHLGRTYSLLGDLSRETGNREKGIEQHKNALSNYFNSIKLNTAAFDSTAMAKTYFEIGKEYARLKYNKMAIKYLQLGSNSLRQNVYGDWIKNGYYLLSDLHYKSGNYQSAYKYKQFGESINDTIKYRAKRVELHQVASRYAINDETRKIEMRIEKERAAEDELLLRTNYIWYSGEFLFVIVSFALLFVFGHLTLAPKFAKPITLISALMLYQLLLFLLYPQMEVVVDSKPQHTLLFKIVVALPALVFYALLTYFLSLEYKIKKFSKYKNTINRRIE